MPQLASILANTGQYWPYCPTCTGLPVLAYPYCTYPYCTYPYCTHTRYHPPCTHTRVPTTPYPVPPTPHPTVAGVTSWPHPSFSMPQGVHQASFVLIPLNNTRLLGFILVGLIKSGTFQYGLEASFPENTVFTGFTSLFRSIRP